MRVSDVPNLDVSSTGLTHEEIIAVWKRLWERQKEYPQITEGVKDDDVEIIIREQGWSNKEWLKNECAIGLYWVFDNLEYGNWVSIDPDTRIVRFSSSLLEGQTSAFIALDEFLNPTTKEQ